MDLRADARQRVVGTLPMAVNERPSDALTMRLVRSTVPHGRLLEIDTSAALAVDGVVTVLTGQDLVAHPDVDPYFGPEVRDRPALAIDVVRYVGEPVAAVVATDDHAAGAAAALIWPGIDELPAATTTAEATAADAAPVHPDAPENAVAVWQLRHGDPDAAFASCHRTFEDVYTTPPASHVPLEPHVCIGTWRDGELDLLTTSQAPFVAREAAAQVLKLPDGDVRVRVRHLGGAFGAKVDAHIEPVVAIAARLTGRTVRLELDRDEVFKTVAKRAATVRMRTGVSADGVLVAREVVVDWNVGAYATSTPGSTGHGMVRAPGPYRIANVAVTSRAIYTNTVPSGPFRGAMTSQLCWAYESQMDDIAHELGIDPVELRRRNLLVDGDTHATGEQLNDVHLLDLMDELVEATGRFGPVSTPAAASHVRGRGMAMMIKSTVTPSRCELTLTLTADGRARVGVTAVDIGQGIRRALASYVARALDLPIVAVDLDDPDTARTPYDTMTASSRTAFVTTEATKDAVRRLREEVLASLAEAGVSVILTGEGLLRSEDGGTLTWASALELLGRAELTVTGAYQSTGGVPALDRETGQGIATAHWHQGGAAVEVEIDVETGLIEVTHLHGTSWAGQILDPLTVRQQNEGGAIFALGPALFEELIYDAGQVVNPNMSDYQIPSILDIPAALSSRSLEHPDPHAEVHGVGEMVVPAVAPAIGNAIRDALGIRLRDLPLTAERVLRALHELRNDPPGGS